MSTGARATRRPFWESNKSEVNVMAESQVRTDGQKDTQNQTRQNQAKSGSTQMTRNQQTGAQQSGGQQSGILSRRRQDPFLMPAQEFFSANPFSIMRRMSEEMDRIFGDFGFGRGQSGAGGVGMWVPAIEVAQREGEYVIHAELPGIKPEEVRVEMADDSIIIQGERRSQNEEN